MGKKKSHGPRYSIKGKPHAWVLRDANGRFKKWVQKSKSLRSDRVWKACKGKKPGYGHKKDYTKAGRRCTT